MTTDEITTIDDARSRIAALEAALRDLQAATFPPTDQVAEAWERSRLALHVGLHVPHEHDEAMGRLVDWIMKRTMQVTDAAERMVQSVAAVADRHKNMADAHRDLLLEVAQILAARNSATDRELAQRIVDHVKRVHDEL